MSERRFKAVPAPLAWLLGAVAVVGVAWALLLPPWQAPDENSHFAYAQNLAERFELPGKVGRPPYSTEQLLATSRSNADQTAGSIVTKPEWSKAAFERWQTRQPRPAAQPAQGRRRAHLVLHEPARLLPVRGIALPGGVRRGDIFDRLYLMRLWSVLLLLVTTTGAWLLAGELFGKQTGCCRS